MNANYFILVIISLIVAYVLALNIEAVSHKSNKLFKRLCTLLFIFSLGRYVALLVYGDHPTYETLTNFRYFYFATSIGLTIPTLSAVWYVTPSYREKIKYPYLLLGMLPWIVFYFYVNIRQPTRIIQSKTMGYQLQLTGNFQTYLTVAQGSFVILVILLALYGIKRYKHLQIRAQLMMIILAQILLTIDGLSYYWHWQLRMIQPFTVSEILGFLAVYYCLALPVKEISRISGI